MSRLLSDLCPIVRNHAMSVIAHCVEQGLAVMIVDTLRTPAEQAQYLASGNSKTRNSKHLAQRSCAVCGNTENSAGELGLSHAIDLAPYEVYKLHGADKLQWDANDPAWHTIGAIGEQNNLEWGGRWTSIHDPGHLQAHGPFLGRSI